jgi:hypothetical protein
LSDPHDDANTFYAGHLLGGSNSALVPPFFCKISLNSETQELKIRFFNNESDQLVETIKLSGLCYTESVLEFKPTGDKKGSREEQCKGRVWILRSDGKIECPVCGWMPDYDKYLEKEYNADHRVMSCLKCLKISWFRHAHIRGVCQPSPAIKEVLVRNKN